MARLIDADALIKNIKEQYKTHDNNPMVCEIVGDIIHNLIETASTVDAEPVRHGKWIDNNAGNHDPRDRWVKCSLCGYSTTDRFSKEYKYCPNCGAKMGESDNE